MSNSETVDASFLAHQLENHQFVSIRRCPRTVSNPPTLNTFSVSPLKKGEKLVPRRKLSTLFEKGAGLNEGGSRKDGVREGKQSSKNKGERVVLEEVVPNTKQRVKCNEKKLMIFEKRKDKQTEEVDDFGDEFGDESEDDSGYWSEDSVFSAVEFGDNEVEGDVVEDEDLFSDFVDESLLKAVNNGLNQSWTKSKTTAEDNSYLFNVDDVEVNISAEADLDLDDDNRCLVGSDDESSPNNLIFDPNVDFGKPIVLKKNLKFRSVQEFRKAVRQHAVENGYEPYFLHNESRRVNIQCRYRCECPWNSKRGRLPKCTCGATTKCEYRIYATVSKDDDDLTFEIKSLNLEHVCAYTTRNRMVSSEFIAEKYLEVWRSDPQWSLQGTQSRVKLDFGVDVNYHKCWLARARANLIIHGNSDEQYSRVWDYVAAIKKHNPGSSAFVMVYNIERPPPIFQRMYICFSSCKEGFLKGCRPLIGVDGCHLKGMYPGMCLVAVAMDGNNNIFPLAWGVVEVENRETWKWFLELLVRDLDREEGDGLTFMSDRQKGLLESMKVVVPKADIRFCVRHIWANFKLQFPGQAYKESFWRAAWATTEAEFKAELEEIKGLSEAAFKYIKGIPPKHWSRHAFSTKCKSSMITNNLCESFNAVLKDARDKPILTHMEWMRRYVMKRNFEKREGVDKYVKKFMPYIDTCFKRLMSEARYCKVSASKSIHFEVDYKGVRNVVNLTEKTCDCFHWQLSGIPCTHAMACILDQRHNPENYVDEVYSKDKYLLAYTPAISPMPGVQQWDRTEHEQPLPPAFRKMPGRPSKRKRRKEPDEGMGQVKRGKKSKKCSRCGTLGHNVKSCKNPQVDPAPRKKGGRPPIDSSWVKTSKKKAEQRMAKRVHDQTILSQIGSSQPSLEGTSQIDLS